MSTLARLFSLANLDLAEEVVQSSLLDALRVWRTQGVPDQPAAWVRRVAKHKLLDLIRKDRVAVRHMPHVGRAEAWDAAFDDSLLDSRIADSQLRMMFVCCDPRIVDADRIALTLKTLCGFGHEEIARAFFSTPEAVKKRIQRAKAVLAEAVLSLDALTFDECERRLNDVHNVLYLLFNEGYLSTADDRAIRHDLCEEAIRLTTLLANHADYGRPSSDALLALMLFHEARKNSRLDDAGRIILLGDQDRSLWSPATIRLACDRLDRSARGTVISRYHLEAGIAYHHCTAPSLATTNWSNVIRLYDALIKACPSPVYQLNRAIAVAERDGPDEGLRAIDESRLQESLSDHYLLFATIGELQHRAGQTANAIESWRHALSLTPSPAERKLIEGKLEGLIDKKPPAEVSHFGRGRE